MKQAKRIAAHVILIVSSLAFASGITYTAFEVGRMVGDGEGWREATEATDLPSRSEINNMANMCSQL
mgnify:CR=1 FL=1|jgi:hypothetical protein